MTRKKCIRRHLTVHRIVFFYTLIRTLDYDMVERLHSNASSTNVSQHLKYNTMGHRNEWNHQWGQKKNKSRKKVYLTISLKIATGTWSTCASFPALFIPNEYPLYCTSRIYIACIYTHTHMQLIQRTHAHAHASRARLNFQFKIGQAYGSTSRINLYHVECLNIHYNTPDQIKSSPTYSYTYIARHISKIKYMALQTIHTTHYVATYISSPTLLWIA